MSGASPVDRHHVEPLQAWSRHLVAQASGLLEGQAPWNAGPVPPLSEREALRLQRYRDRLLRALHERDRAALMAAKQDVVRAAFASQASSGSSQVPSSPALRRALRELAWRMSGLLLPRVGSR